jgi:hypothetical protein
VIVKDVAHADKSGHRYYVKVRDNRPDGTHYEEDFVIKVPEDRVAPLENEQYQVQLKATGEWVEREYVDRAGEKQIRPLSELTTYLKMINHRRYIKSVIERQMKRARRSGKQGDNTGAEILKKFSKDRKNIGDMKTRLQADDWKMQENKIDNARRIK